MGNTPISFGCAKCRLRWSAWRRGNARKRGTLDRVSLTGRTRPNKIRAIREAQRSGLTRYEYRCGDCMHVGWSAHPDVGRKADRDGIEPHERDTSGLRRFEKANKKSAP